MTTTFKRYTHEIDDSTLLLKCVSVLSSAQIIIGSESDLVIGKIVLTTSASFLNDASTMSFQICTLGSLGLANCSPLTKRMYQDFSLLVITILRVHGN